MQISDISASRFNSIIWGAAGIILEKSEMYRIVFEYFVGLELRQVGFIWQHLSFEVTKIHVSSFVFSRLDYCNAFQICEFLQKLILKYEVCIYICYTHSPSPTLSLAFFCPPPPPPPYAHTHKHGNMCICQDFVDFYVLYGYFWLNFHFA